MKIGSYSPNFTSVRPRIHSGLFIAALLSLLFASCRSKNPVGATQQVENMYADTISTSYTVAMPDDKGEGFRITYTFFNMKRADTGNFKMTHVYMRYTGTDDTMIVNGTWKKAHTDSGDYVNVYSGRSVKRFDYENEWNLHTFNTDSVLADTGWMHFREKKDNNLANSTVRLFGKVSVTKDHNATFIDEDGDSIPIMKVSAFPELIETNDSVPLNSSSIKGVELLGTIQIRMSMDGRSTQKSLIVEDVLGVKR